MAICAGYVSARSLFETQSVKESIEEFSILGKTDADREVVDAIRTKYGHQVCKYNLGQLAQPRIAKDAEGNFLVLLGFIRWNAAREEPDLTDHLLQLAVTEGAAVLERLEGQYVVIFGEGHSGFTHIVNDRFASRPFYILQTGQASFYSSNLAFLFRLARISPIPDPLGWLQIFNYDHTLGRRTNCVGVERLLPASHLLITPERIKEISYWKLEHNPDDSLDADAFADEVFHAFQESTVWRASRVPRSIIALSGGLDSRLVAACVPKNDNARAFTFINSVESADTPEVLAASEVAHRLGLPHEIKRIKIGSYSKNAENVVRLTDGLVALHHSSKVMQFIERLEGDSTYLLGGGPGDSLAGAFVPNEDYLDPASTTLLVQTFCAQRALGSSYLSMIFGDEFLRETVPQLNASILESFSGITGPTAAHQITAWAMTIRQPAFTFTSPFHNHPMLHEGTAHLGYRYADLMLRLPADWILYKNFYRYMIYRCIPNLRDVIYANTGRPLSGRLERFDYQRIKPLGWQKRVKTQLKKIPMLRQIRAYLSADLSRRPNRSFDYSILQQDEILLNRTEDMLDIPAIGNLVDKTRCRKFIKKYRDGRVQISSDIDASLLASLATLCYSTKGFQYLTRARQ